MKKLTVKIKTMSKKEKELLSNGWCLDTHSTILSRKCSKHCMIGKKRYTKIIRKN